MIFPVKLTQCSLPCDTKTGTRGSIFSNVSSEFKQNNFCKAIFKIWQIFNFLDNCSKDILHILHKEGEQ